MKKMLLLILGLLFAGQVFADSPIDRGGEGSDLCGLSLKFLTQTVACCKII
jgi:hypothetical protein